MLQSLLSERFGLVVRRDTRPVPRYVLTVGKSGSKLKSADPSATPVPASRSRSPARRLPTFPPLPTSKWRAET